MIIMKPHQAQSSKCKAANIPLCRNIKGVTGSNEPTVSVTHADSSLVTGASSSQSSPDTIAASRVWRFMTGDAAALAAATFFAARLSLFRSASFSRLRAAAFSLSAASALTLPRCCRFLSLSCSIERTIAEWDTKCRITNRHVRTLALNGLAVTSC